MKKLISFIIILVFVLAGAYVLFNSFITETLWPDTSTNREAVSAMCVDNRGNVYYVRDKAGENHLVGTDDAGNVILDEVPEAIGDSSKYLVTDIYVTENNNIVISTMTYDRTSEQASEMTINVFFEDGAFAVRALNYPCSQNVVSATAKGTRFSAVGEDASFIYFSLYTDDHIELYGMQKGTYEIASKITDFDYNGLLTCYIPTSGKEIVVGAEFGKLCLLTEDGQQTLLMPTGVVIGKIWAGTDGALYVFDAADKDIYKVQRSTLTAEVLAKGSTVVAADQGVSLGDFRALSLSRSGIVAGLLKDGNSWEIYTGGANYMDNVAVRSSGSFNVSIFGVIGIAIGSILLAILIWDGFVGFFKMHLSIMIRSGVLITVSVIAMLYALLSYVIAPSMQTILTKQYENHLYTADSIMASAISASSEGTSTYAVFHSVSDKVEAESNSISPLHFDLLTENGVLLMSSDSIHSDYDADIIPLRTPLKSHLKNAAESGTVSIETYESTGPRMYVLMPLSDGRILCVTSSTASVEAHINDVKAKTKDFLVMTGGIMILVFMLIELYTALSIRKLKRCVDEVSAGNYDIAAHINSGDEVESLTNSFNTMTRFIRGNMLQLERVNRAYYRFVPENLLRILGVSSIENLGKDSYTKSTMAVLVTSFRFSEKSTSAEELFKKINQVTERIAPVVVKNSGTVYDFKYDGFHAVFDENSENAVRAALQIREEAEALNTELKKGGEKPVDVRIFIGMGEVMLGIIGDENRMSASAISEVINTANALVDICRESDIYIGCTRQVFEGVKGYRSRYIGSVELKNERVELIDIFDGDPYALLKHKEMYATQFSQAVTHFYNGNFEAARNLFMQIVQASLKDGASRNYMYYADKFNTGGCSNPTYQIFGD